MDLHTHRHVYTLVCKHQKIKLTPLSLKDVFLKTKCHLMDFNTGPCI